jgi:hypothetical protein
MLMDNYDTDEACPFCISKYPISFCLWDKEKGCFGDTDKEGSSTEYSDYSSEERTEQDFSVPENWDNESSDSSGEGKVYKDARSTGRKRAALLYPIQPGQVCEWAWHKNCGGGITPIVGCTGRPASHIHHGPDKSTLNNDRSNISLVCEYCHNRWHVANDPYYSNPRPANGETWLPYKEGTEVQGLDTIQKASKEEILMHEMLIPTGGKDK